MDFEAYLNDELGLPVIAAEWPGVDELPIFLANAAHYRLCSCGGVDFIAAVVGGERSLPELKRASSQVAARSGLLVVLVAQVDARQRRALVSQGVPFVVPGRQAYLPMLGFAASPGRDLLPLAGSMPPGAQAAFVALLANPDLRTTADLMEATGMPPSSMSRALDDLSRRGLIGKSKEGRQVTVRLLGGREELVERALGALRTPVVKELFARRSGWTGRLPLAGESALAERSMLAEPKMECRAVAKGAIADISLERVELGELPDGETVRVQVWSYDPLVAGKGQVDDVSLALSLAAQGDERVVGQLNGLFGKELWQ